MWLLKSERCFVLMSDNENNNFHGSMFKQFNLFLLIGLLTIAFAIFFSGFWLFKKLVNERKYKQMMTKRHLNSTKKG